MDNYMDNSSIQNQVDKQALDLTHAIALGESDNGNGVPDYNAVGKSGEKGAYQWMPGNFESTAKKYGFDPSDFSPKNQDMVKYAEVKDLKNQGYQPAEIAAKHNSGSFNNWKDHKGSYVDKKTGNTIEYDTPAYVQKVKSYYQTLSGQGAPIPEQNSSENTDKNNQEQTLGSQLSQRANDAGSALKDLGENLITGKGTHHWWSDILHVGGAIGGGIGDIINKGLELIPGVKEGENALGRGVSHLADTEVGKSVISSINSFKQEHPELSQDVGDIFNIVTAIPILKGIGTVAKVGESSLATALKGAVIKGVKKDFEDAVGREVSSDVMKTMVDNGIIPSVEKTAIGNAKGSLIYNTKNALDKLQSVINDIPKEHVTDITDILTNMNGKMWTPGKLVSGINKGSKFVGAAIGETIAPGITGGLAGTAGGMVGNKITKGIANRVVKTALKNGGKSVVYPTIKKLGTSSAGLVGSALSQKVRK